MTAITTLPQLHIDLDGVALDTETLTALREVTVNQRLSFPAVCELTFLEPEPDLVSRTGLVPGSELRLYLDAGAQLLFAGRVTALEHSFGPAGEREIKVRAHDRLYLLSKRQPVRSHVQTTVAEIAAVMVADLGISVDAETTGPLWQNLVQFDKTDLEFLHDVAARSGLYFVLLDNELSLFPLTAELPDETLVSGETLFEIRIKSDADWCCGSVAATGWNPWRATPHSAAVQTDDLSQPFFQRTAEADFSAPVTLSDGATQSDAELEALARERLAWRAAARQAVEGAAEGSATLRAGSSIALEGLSPALNGGCYRLTEVTHRIAADTGFITLFSSAPPKPPKAATQNFATLGHVTQVEDPEHLGRVKVCLPAYQDVESDWLQVLVPGAGINKGLLALPDVGDRVLVLMLQQRPDQAIVVGGLYGEDGPGEETVKSGAVTRYTFRTPDGQTIRLDDNDHSVTVENRAGTRIRLAGERIHLKSSHGHELEMAHDNMRLHAETDFEIEAPGRTITICADKIDFQRR